MFFDKKKNEKDKDKSKKKEPPVPTQLGRKKKRRGPDAAHKLPTITPNTRCRLKRLRLERVKDFLLMEEEFVANQERLRPADGDARGQKDRARVDDLRGAPMSVGTLEEIIDDHHAIISSAVGPEYYVGIASFVDKDQLELGASVLLHSKTMSIVGVLPDDTDPMVYDSHSGGEREIQRTMLELLNQLDGFDARGDVKVLMATNRIESLDPALIRPGRIDRKIEFPLPDIRTKRGIFNIHTARMTLAPDVDPEELITTKDDLSGADIKAVCTEAGLLALRDFRMRVTAADFRAAKETVMYRKHDNTPEGMYL
ncbi:hypothetical protein H696_03951 [Fonticula alba]|uniref:26S protease regulatory subunit 4 n=1 Tax=Fonticula alba TaxID=691883 RepID=A0A058Z5L1_FONAL|nr:hypothetical protein H696_03951 [Fonticula alba]KCV69530.1 hypothetical protein H696_03951 [Fonticula alba]|eukprot:XP_009496095.1 hypothetical protein H696_03951 [Fonticula alba]